MPGMKPLTFSRRSLPFAFAAVTLVAYGLLLPFTGFYWDDWPFAFLARFLGPRQFIPAFAGFRPFLGPIFFLTTSLIPPHPLLWQVFALLIRFLSGLAVWFTLNALWPDHPRHTLSAALLFLVFPAYSQHWVAFTHINQEWIPLLGYLLSFGFSVRALREPRRSMAYTVCALLLQVGGLFPTEYFFGLEPLRWLLLWVVVAEGTPGVRPRLLRTLRRAWPYLLIWAANAAWLAYYYRSGAYVSYEVSIVHAPPSVLEILLTLGDALWKVGLYAWVQILVLSIQSIPAPATLASLLLTLLAFVLLNFYLARLDLNARASRSPAVPAMGIGLVGILLGRLPSLLAGLPLTLQSSYDRLTISMMLGGSLWMAGAVEFLAGRSRMRLPLLAALLALGVGQQFFNANIFRRDWQRQQAIYWQFAWRMPALQPDTVVLTHQMPLDYETDLSMTASLNWMYVERIDPPRLPYALIYTEKRLGGAVLPHLGAGSPIRLPYRTLTFTGNTSQAIVVYVPPNGCLRVLDPAYGDAETYARFPEALSRPIPLSDPSRIVLEAEARSLPSPPFSAEPPHSWCYFYEKAEQARQSREWQEITELGRQAAAQGFAPQDAFEWLPFIEAYARTGELAAAGALTRQAWEQEPRLRRGLCALWRRIQALDAPAASVAAGLLTEMSCGP